MELNELYRDVILDHNRHPRNFGDLDGADARVEGFNPMCGDRLTLKLKMAGENISDIRFEGQGCAISVLPDPAKLPASQARTEAKCPVLSVLNLGTTLPEPSLQ